MTKSINLAEYHKLFRLGGISRYRFFWPIAIWPLLLSLFLIFMVGCVNQSSDPSEVAEVWGRRGIGDGRFQKPRAIAVDEQDRLYIVDMTGRIQVFDADHQLISKWRTPEVKSGKPCGLTIANDGNLMVADTHYYRILFYDSEGQQNESRTIGGTNGRGEGEFGFVTDVIQDSKGNYYISEYGDFDRIQKFTAEGEFLFQWGGHGTSEGEFLRPQGLAIDDNDHLWVADASNHRIQVFDATGDSAKLLKTWGKPGKNIGEMRYPYDIALDGKGHIYVCEFGNHRIQKFDLDGNSKGFWDHLVASQANCTNLGIGAGSLGYDSRSRFVQSPNTAT